MQSVSEALASILQQAKPLAELQTINIESALGKTLAEDMTSPIDLPPFANSAMDGFALRYEDLQGEPPFQLAISQTIAAGYSAPPHKAGTAARLFTGAMIPKGANTVVIQEDTEVLDGFVIIKESPTKGQHIRKQGEELNQGSVLLPKGQPLTPAAIALLASAGIEQVRVHKPLTIAILTSGDELVLPGNPLSPGQIYNSNRFLIGELLKQWQCIPLFFDNINDDLNSLVNALKAASEYDMIISTGGVSVGAADLLKQAVCEVGELQQWKVAMKPGKPLAFGRIQTTPYFGLPGNPVSAFVTAYLFVKPFIHSMRGESLAQQRRPAKALFNETSNERQQYLRVQIDDQGQAHKFQHQGSGVLSSLNWANALAEIPPHTKVSHGDEINVIELEQ